MYTFDKTERITVRLTDNQKRFVDVMAASMDLSPSEYVRQLIDIAIFGYNNTLPLDEAPGDPEPSDFYDRSWYI